MSCNGSGVFNINTAGQPVVTGTVISSTAFNALTADLATGLSTCVTKDGQTNPTANLPMAGYKLTGLGTGSASTDSATLGQVQSNTVSLIGSISGTNTITGSLSPAITAYAAGQMFWFVAASANTGATTININSLGAKSITKNGTAALVANDIKSGQTVVIVYDGTQFQLTGSSLIGITPTTTTGVVALGLNAGDSITTGSYNTCIGYNAGTAITTSDFNTCVGNAAAPLMTSAENTAIGYAAMSSATSGSGNNTAVGNSALSSMTTGNTCTGVGHSAGTGLTSDKTGSSFLGYNAGNSGNYSNITCLGASSVCTGDNQVQLGNSSTTTYAYGAVQDRSDLRDKADIRDTQLGLDFVMALRPRDFKWDMREDYRPAPPAADATPEEKAAFQEACKLANLTHDGTYKRNRYHHGLIAQEVKQTMDAMGVDFGGYQDHTIKGGDAVLTIGYEELVAPLIKAIQELKADFDAYKASHP